MITAWRLVRPEYADDAFSGDGSVLYAGRWHSEGTRVVYVAESVSLATLEILVHMPRGRKEIPSYILIPCYFHEALVEEVDVDDLPDDWAADIAPATLRNIGDAWARDRVSPVLKVPSAITRMEFNYLLNPEHPDFNSVDIGQGREFRIDLRLVT